MGGHRARRTIAPRTVVALSACVVNAAKSEHSIASKVVSVMELPNADGLVAKDAELRSLISQITSRQTRGGGRYNKWETARLRFMRTSALPNLRLGKLPSRDDERMLYLPASKDACTSGPDKTAMEAWAQKWARDPRSKRPDDNLSETEQTTLMQWAKNTGVPFVVPPRAAAGAPPSYKCASRHRARVHTRA